MSHSAPYLIKARSRGGWSRQKSINIDKAQGREYENAVVPLLGMAALYRFKIPGYKERIYTTMTRGKKNIFYVPYGTSRGIINAAKRDLIKALSEIKRPMPLYDTSILNLKAPRRIKSYMASCFTRYHRLHHTAVSGKAQPNPVPEAEIAHRTNCGGKNKRNKKREPLHIYNKTSRFWPKKPRTTALARLF